MTTKLLKKKINLTDTNSCGLYYKSMTIVNDNARIINKLNASFTDDARVIIYDRQMFIVQAIGFTQPVNPTQPDLLSNNHRSQTTLGLDKRRKTH